MAKIYSENSINQKEEQFEPKKETIDFLLSYSKALNVLHCNELKFEALLN
ncbi:hypothetical protein [Algibacter mikhailovii]|uniref:Uncharacterized protein n=1 Tax=Algibacter mikhailovii TaxID=425498 RepID=A0A918V5Z8_9FLAO|nr:hypothetical protein [Algibacter mikhailovii]GGZ69030.1 hypothetical protein GCM10007028_02460 [Algibacter mikhailovii]